MIDLIIASSAIELRKRICDSISRHLLDLSISRAIAQERKDVCEADVELSVQPAFEAMKKEIFPNE